MLHMIIIAWCVSLPSGLVEQLKRDDPGTIQHLENTINTLSTPLRPKVFRPVIAYLTSLKKIHMWMTYRVAVACSQGLCGCLRMESTSLEFASGSHY